MNREIKFRAWDKKENRFFPWHTTKLHLGNWASKPESFPEIMLMQFTGLKDKNGKEIYEGDVLQMTNAMNERINFAVYWGTGLFTDIQWAGFRYGKSGMILNDDDMERCEVIGNIYENQELLTNQGK